MEVIPAGQYREWYEKSRLVPYLAAYIRLPAPLVMGVRHVQDELRDTDSRQIYCPESSLHITVKEFGWLGEDVKAEGMSKVIEIVRRVASKCKPFEIGIDGVGIFPTAIYGAVGKGADEIRGLNMSLVRELGDSVVESEYDGVAMKPHATMLLFATQDVEPLLRKATSMATRFIGETAVDEVQVVKRYPHRLFESAGEQETASELVATFKFEGRN